MSTPLVQPSPASSPTLSRRAMAADPSLQFQPMDPTFHFGQDDLLKLSVEVSKSDHYDQIQEVKNILQKDLLIHPSRIDPEVDWFYLKLGIDIDYFDSTPAHVIAKHILALYSAKMVSHATNNRLEVQLHSHAEGGAVFITPSDPGARDSPAMALEQMIEAHFLGEPSTLQSDISKVTKMLSLSQTSSPPKMPPHGFRLACYRSAGGVSPTSNTRLRMYFLSTPEYPVEAVPGETGLQALSDKEFWARSSDNTKKIYQEVVNEVTQRIGPVIKVFPAFENEKGARLVIGYKRGSTHSYWSALSDLYHSFGMFTTHKYVEQLQNDIVICSMYLHLLNPDTSNVTEIARKLAEQASLCYVLPRTSLTSMFTEGPLSAEEVTYAYVLWKFSYQFLNRFAAEYDVIAQALRKDVKAKNMLATMKSRLMKDTFTESRVREAIMLYPALIKDLYKDFVHYHQKKPGKAIPAYDRTHGTDIYNNIIKQTTTELDAQVFTACLNFNRHVLKTNYFKATKVALSFRLDPAFIDIRGYAELPYGVFFVVGSEFRGFHIRFRDIARGGIRIIRSANKTTYDQNSASLFEENYNLAYTQQQKNKDIPEGGSKGTILLTTDHQNKADVAFRKYIDALLDVLLPTEEMIDYYGKEEILFLGPDEGTADYMDWASQHARTRKYPFWKAFTTGKSPSIGGIPHDLHGMTTRSIHQYVLGVLSKLKMDEKNCSKFQTGGPDGDLGSNEIKISHDKTIGIVDGSGVLFDPNGIDRTELLRLATGRMMSNNFNKSKLSPQGFFVSITDSDVVLPNGTPVSSGMAFRNSFHLNSIATADLFVPCGGRPESVQLNNVEQMFNKDGTPRFKIIIEGANLFFTQNARLILEEKGVIIFKDASANKGGVTSSSLEVFSALALNDEEFADKMMVKGGVIPPFHQAYIADVHRKIEENARLEFECIWREHEKSGTPRCVLSDELSRKINELNDQIQTSPLWDDIKLRNRILSEACPKTLLDLVGMEKITQRVPETYMRAIFGASLASRFVYECGIHSPEFAFFTFVQKYINN
jgi:glutamate dehydrogenase